MEVFVFTPNSAEWEDMIVYTDKEDAITKSKKHPKVRLEIFVRGCDGGYRPTYSYFLNGSIVQTSHGIY